MMRRAILGAGAGALALVGMVCVPRHLPTPIASSSLTPATFHARIELGTLTLRGSLPSETSKAAILQRAQELYGTKPGRVVDELAVDPRVGPAAWAGNIPRALPLLRHMMERGSIIIDGRSIVLSGRVDGDRAKTTVLQDIAPLIQTGLELEDHILAARLPAPSSSLQKQLNEILSHASVEFESNTTTMLPRGRATLDQLIALLRRAPHTAIEIGGHTDKYGEPDYNLQLSRRRAEAVRDYFISHGLTTQFTAFGYGASRPLSVAQTRAGFQHNRRIELRVKGVRDL
ncbi:MAG: OmpA/MotB family outer membrane protein [Nitrospira sp.]|nr:MAG: OmpA/MotB family outer membrane protein [Nitrospira sp.]